MGWLLLILAAALEPVWATALKQSAGLSRLWPSVIGVGGAFASFALLSAALRSLPVGTAYAVWVGLGAAGVFLSGVLFLSEQPSLPRIGFVALILIGVVGLSISEG